MIAESLSRAIVEHTFADYAQPISVKDVAGRYGSCYRTVRKALDQLTADGLVERTGKRFRIVAPRAPSSSGRIVLIAFGNQGMVDLVSNRTQLHLHALERACARAGLFLDIVACAPNGTMWKAGTAVASADDASDSRRPTIGYVFWTVALPSEVIRRTLNMLARSGRPVAVLDETGVIPVPSAGARSLVRVFRIACGRDPGVRIGQLLGALGHRRVAYLFASEDSAALAASRCEGLRIALGAFSDAEVRSVRLSTTGREGMTTHTDPVMVESRVRHAFSTHFPRLTTLDTAHAKQAVDMIRDLTIRSELLTAYRPQLEHLLATGGQTAWVAFNDSLALGLLQFLRDMGSNVPARHSVVGFDNSIQAYLARLTTYDFNGTACMEAMLSFVLGDKRMRRATAVCDISGFVVERQTIAAAPANTPA